MATKRTLAKRKKLADLIRKGKKDYPEVSHIQGDWVQFDVDGADWVPARACAIGFAILGEYDGKVHIDNVLEYVEKIRTQFIVAEKGRTYWLTGEVTQYNDKDKLPLDEIILALEVGG